MACRNLLLLLLATAMPVVAANPLARFPSLVDANGRWNGVNLERRTACANAQNDGTRGTYAQFDVTADASGNFAITQAGITGLTCTYAGRQRAAAGAPAVSGTYSCSDGKQGEFETTSLEVGATALQVRMRIQLAGTERCAIDGLLSLARMEPQ